MEIRVATPDVSEVTFEVLYVDCIESDDGRVKTNIGLSQPVAEIEGSVMLCEIGFGTIERGEQCLDILLVRFLCPRSWVSRV